MRIIAHVVGNQMRVTASGKTESHGVDIPMDASIAEYSNAVEVLRDLCCGFTKADIDKAITEAKARA